MIFQEGNIAKIIVNNQSYKSAYFGNDLIYVEPIPMLNYLCFEAMENNSTVGVYSKATGSAYEYSTDQQTWYTFTSVTLSSVGDKIYLKGHSAEPANNTYNRFQITGKIKASGSIMSIYDYDIDETSIITYGCFMRLFYNCTGLTNAPSLPATTLSENCYASMFQGCTSLVTAPALPASVVPDLAYHSMFSGCTSLVNAPNMYTYSVGWSSCMNMFSGCSSLVTAPVLNATYLDEACYSGMFSSCINLTTVPKLPATTLPDHCYASMFSDCDKLTTLPYLRATQLGDACYAGMFYDCPLIRVSTSSYVGYYMFRLPASGTATGIDNCGYESMFSRITIEPYVSYYTNARMIG